MAQKSAVAIFITEAAEANHHGVDGLAEAFGLSKAETRTLKALAETQDPTEVAARLNIAHSTVKSHLRKIFQKTNTSRQADLLRLVECCRPRFEKTTKADIKQTGPHLLDGRVEPGKDGRVAAASAQVGRLLKHSRIVMAALEAAIQGNRPQRQ